jgi:hypothetical protein
MSHGLITNRVVVYIEISTNRLTSTSRKIGTQLSSLSPYKNCSSLLRWQANLFVPIATTGLFLLLMNFILVVCGLVGLLALRMLLCFL